MADGKDAGTVKEFADFLEAHGGKRKAKGYQTKRNLKAIVYLIAGDVLANSPT